MSLLLDPAEELLSKARLLYGTEAEPQPIRVQARRFSFELVGGNLRALKFGGVEVLRGIQYLVRDRDWGTLVPKIEQLQIDDGESTQVKFSACCADENCAYLAYDARIVASNSELEFMVDCVVREDITVSRLGFCVLHAAELAGHPLRVEHSDGSIEPSIFPVLIEPWQPFTNIRALTHEQGTLSVECRLEGDTFEMEDQRNWSDASFKTYVRPLALPWPYEIRAGTRVRQSVRIRVSGTAPALRNSGSDIDVRIGGRIGTMPRIGLVVTSEEAPLTEETAEWVAQTGVQDLLLTFDASAREGAAELRALADVGAKVNARRTLECILACTDDLDAELNAIALLVREAGLDIDAVAVFPAPDLQSTPPGSKWPECPPLEDVYAAARRAFPRLKLGGGMFSYFTEFNRKRVPTAQLDFVAHATCPIVHAADDVSAMQTLQTIPHILRSARAIVPDKPYRLGPITIGMRQNPYGSRTIPNPNRGRVPMTREDPRQDGRFASAWTLGYAAATEDAALDTLTLGGLTGPTGLLGRLGPRPVFHAVSALADMAGAQRRSCRTSSPSTVAAICAGDVLLLANLTAEPVRVRTEWGQSESLDSFATVRMAVG